MRGLVDLLVDLLLRGLGQLQSEAHVLADRHVRVQRVVLEHHRDVPVLGRSVVDDLTADLQLAVGDVFESGDHPQCGRLSAPGGAHQDHQLAVGNVEVHVLDGLEAVWITLGDVVELDLGHVLRLSLSLNP